METAINLSNHYFLSIYTYNNIPYEVFLYPHRILLGVSQYSSDEHISPHGGDITSERELFLCLSLGLEHVIQFKVTCSVYSTLRARLSIRSIVADPPGTVSKSWSVRSPTLFCGPRDSNSWEMIALCRVIREGSTVKKGKKSADRSEDTP